LLDNVLGYQTSQDKDIELSHDLAKKYGHLRDYERGVVASLDGFEHKPLGGKELRVTALSCSPYRQQQHS
jgi:hypothetical protein